MTRDYVLSWIDPEQPRNDDGTLNWHQELYQTRRACVEALLKKPAGDSHYINGSYTSRAMAHNVLSFYENHETWVAEERRLAAEKTAKDQRREQAGLEAAARSLHGTFGLTMGLGELHPFWSDVAQLVIDAYQAGKEV